MGRWALAPVDLLLLLFVLRGQAADLRLQRTKERELLLGLLSEGVEAVHLLAHGLERGGRGGRLRGQRYGERARPGEGGKE